MRLKILVACEFSGVLRDALLGLGHDAWSCDLLYSEKVGPHIRGDVREVLCGRWDMMVAFPPCTYLCSSGAAWWSGRKKEQLAALDFVRVLLNAPIPKIALENPIGRISTVIRKPDQIIQPYMFGHGEAKATCLWLRGLPELLPTKEVSGRKQRVHYEAPGPDRWKRRSRLLPGIARAMATQWAGSFA